MGNEAHKHLFARQVVLVGLVSQRGEQLISECVTLLAPLNMTESVPHARLLQDIVQNACIGLTNVSAIDPDDHFCYQSSNACLLLPRLCHLIDDVLDLSEIFLETSGRRF